MSGHEILEITKKRLNRLSRAPGDPIFRHVLVCVDTSPFSHAALAHAAAVAFAAGARLTVMRILEPSASQAPTDPVEWTLRHRDIEAELRERASHFNDLHADVVVIDGPAAEGTPGCASNEVGDDTVRYRRVMTPLDGSSRWECALPIAGIAAAHDAELVLVQGSLTCTAAQYAANRQGWNRLGDRA
jgi:universal stress protein family protein